MFPIPLIALSYACGHYLANKYFKSAAASVAVAAGAYLGYAATAWLRYGHPRAAFPGDDHLLDRFMPEYEVSERHRIRVAAPAHSTFEAGKELDFSQSAAIRAIFKAREWILGARAAPNRTVNGLLAQMKDLGWGVLAEVPGREIVMGAVTQPWVADVVFRALPPSEFRNFAEPGFVKIVWTLRADEVDLSHSIASTETRVSTTDPTARRKFRRYWSFFSPGIILIRYLTLVAWKSRAEEQTGSEPCQPLTK